MCDIQLLYLHKSFECGCRHLENFRPQTKLMSIVSGGSACFSPVGVSDSTTIPES